MRRPTTGRTTRPITRRIARSDDAAGVAGTILHMASLDVDAMLARFRDRAKAVKQRPLPPVAGEERTNFIQQAKLDFQDFAIIGAADASLDDGVLTLRVDLRPADARD